MMLLVFPLQASWGAIATFCQHEEWATATKHVIAVSDAKADKNSTPENQKVPFNFDDDCAICHLVHHSNVIFSADGVTLPLLLPVLIAVATPHDAFVASSPFARPERPKWTRPV